MNEEVVGYQGRELTYHINSRRSVFDILLCQWVRDKKRSRLFVPTFNHVWKNIFKLDRFQQAVKVKPLKLTLAVRFAPIAPFNLINFLLGITPINYRDYTVGRFFGIIPATLVYTCFGVTGEQALTGGDRLPFFLALSFLALLSIIPILVRNKN